MKGDPEQEGTVGINKLLVDYDETITLVPAKEA
jgi:hypothetical protein